MSSIQRVKKQGIIHKYPKNERGNYTCHYCEYETKNMSTISEHVSRLHPEEAGRQLNAFECEHCYKRFQTSTQKNHHITNYHTEASLCCPFEGCVQVAKNQQSLQSHYSNKHLNKEICIVIETFDSAQCNSCKKRMKIASVPYHIARCNSMSPFFKGSVMCDGGDDIVLFVPRK